MVERHHFDETALGVANRIRRLVAQPFEEPAQRTAQVQCAVLDAMEAAVRIAGAVRSDAMPEPGSHWYDADRSIWCVVGSWKSPEHRDYHRDWTGEYVAIRPNGLLSAPPRLVYLPLWPELFTLAWEPMRVCRFCGFTRMAPCKTRQPCPNLSDRSFTEPPEPAGEERA